MKGDMENFLRSGLQICKEEEAGAFSQVLYGLTWSKRTTRGMRIPIKFPQEKRSHSE